MVAITVILAAVIATFVFGMSGSITKTKIVAATVQQPTQGTIAVTYQGGQDAGSFNYAEVVVTTESGAAATFTALAGTNGDKTTFVAVTNAATPGHMGGVVGNSITAKPIGTDTFSGKDHVVVVGYFTDSTQQVIIDTYV